MSKKRIPFTKTILPLFIIVLLGIPFFAQNQDEELKYKVSVNVMVVPIFAVDKNGNPVFDLKQEELQLYVSYEK